MKALLTLLTAAATLAGQAGAATAISQLDRPVDAAELAALRAEVPPELFGTPSLTGAVEEAIAWRCDAGSYYYGGDFYWISYNVAYSASQALFYCNAYYGGGCVYSCGAVPF